jgi:hypothetical protein
MLGIMMIVEHYFDSDLRFSSPLVQDWKQSGRFARRQACRNEILCFGDSMMKFGIAPRVIESRLGKRALSLAIFASPPSADFFLFRRALESGSRPAAVIVDFLPFHFFSNACGNPDFTRSWPVLTGPRDWLDLASRTRNPDLLAAIVLGRLLPSVRSRYEIRDNIRAAFRGEDVTIGKAIANLLRHIRNNRGAMFSPSNPHSPEKIEDSYPWTYNESATYVPETMAYIRRFFDLAAERGIPVFLLLPPMHPVTQSSYDRNGLTAINTRFARAAVSRYPNVVLIDGRRAGFDHTLFCGDKVHLNARGGAALSLEVAAIIRRHLANPAASPRWIDLPSIHGHPSEMPRKDFETSIAAMEARWAKWE